MATNEFKQERIDYAKAQSIAEKQLLPLFRKALKQTISRVIQYANDYGLDGLKPESLINPNVWDSVYPTAYQMIGMKLARNEYYRQRRLEGIEQKASAIDFLVDIWSGTFRDYALNYVYQIRRDLNQTTIDIINKALGDSYSLGLDRDGSVRLFEKLLNGKMSLRTLTISRTEATTISNLGKDIGARSWIEESGTQGYKVWLGRNDVRERPTHIHENDTIIKLEEKFVLQESGFPDDKGDRPGDVEYKARNRINCRCTVSYMTSNRYNAYVKRGRIVNGKLTGAS